MAGQDGGMVFSPVAAGVWRAHEWGLDAQGLAHWMAQALEPGQHPARIPPPELLMM